jgi:hypothetical protein
MALGEVFVEPRHFDGREAVHHEEVPRGPRKRPDLSISGRSTGF